MNFSPSDLTYSWNLQASSEFGRDENCTGMVAKMRRAHGSGRLVALSCLARSKIDRAQIDFGLIESTRYLHIHTKSCSLVNEHIHGHTYETVSFAVGVRVR